MEVHQWLVDWTQPELVWVLVAGSKRQTVRQQVRGLTEGLAEALGTTVGRSIPLSCGPRPGDERCGFDLAQAGFSVETSVEAGSDGARIIVTAGFGEFSEGWFTNGNSCVCPAGNLEKRARSSTGRLEWEGARVALWRACSTTQRRRPVPGWLAAPQANVDLQRKFSNLLNFRGFPHIRRGLVAAYPGRRYANHDGGSTQ